MSGPSTIEWTDATWNPIRGCSRITTGCGGPNHEGGCYAEKIAARFSDPGQPFHGFAERTPHGGRWTGKLALVDAALTVPLHWKKPRRIFVNSMSDLFHENLPDEAIDRVFAVMTLSPQHTFQILTKRAERMRAYMERLTERCDSENGITDILRDVADAAMVDWRGGSDRWPLPNVWLGVSTERQQEADERIPLLLRTPAAVRFISAEPLLGPIDLGHWIGSWEARGGLIEYLDLVIVGGESGRNARFMEAPWPRSLRDQCAATDTPFFFKQWGEFGRVGDQRPCPDHLPEDADVMTRVGKARAGRLLDGIEHNAMPKVTA